MQDIRNLSIEDLLTQLKEHKLCSCYETTALCKSRRKMFEKRLFLHIQDKEDPPLHQVVSNGCEYFLLDIDLPQTWSPGKSILKKTSIKKLKSLFDSNKLKYLETKPSIHTALKSTITTLKASIFMHLSVLMRMQRRLRC